MSGNLIDLYSRAAETATLAVRNTIDNNDGITIKFLANVPGHKLGEQATISAARARQYIAAHQAQAII